MGQTDLDPNFVIQEAARFIVETPKAQRPGAAIVEIRSRYPLDAQDACAAIRLANLIRAGGVDAAA
ncbi:MULTISPECIES: hypothetical protein [unclassified Mesorhizobium]|uniref:hypothetical protein n=1 Tax=unclassified Mesorhizobium TaxID=325217 RepID=UPI0003CF6973|nr:MULTISPECIES: hypothetical protein [unclassified Mesorhizobium]ESY20391.1 hypothetical protein X749_29530 [Mesorhizobium sp. LNJC391B00]RUW92047.1 hypothetical protein EOA19_11750 [Mesorhizobium sp. M7A.F.Ca.US.010.02.1.1]